MSSDISAFATFSLEEEFGSEIKTEVTDITEHGEVCGTKVSILVPASLTGKTKSEIYDTYHYH